jgi:hypothetical protein
LLAHSTKADKHRLAPASAEQRGHRRSRSEQLRLTFLGADHIPLNWSESGALLEDRHPEVEVGTVLPGILIIGANSLRFRFSAEVVRRDPHMKQIAIQFVDPSPYQLFRCSVRRNRDEQPMNEIARKFRPDLLAYGAKRVRKEISVSSGPVRCRRDRQSFRSEIDRSEKAPRVMDEQRERAEATLEQPGSLMGWWGIGTNRVIKDRVQRFEQLASGFHRAYSEACDGHFEVLAAANECVTRSFQGLLNSRRPDEFFAAQSEVLSGLTKLTTLQMKAWTEFGQRIQGCYMDVARDTTSDIEHEAREATSEVEQQVEQTIQSTRQRIRRAAREVNDQGADD